MKSNKIKETDQNLIILKKLLDEAEDIFLNNFNTSDVKRLSKSYSRVQKIINEIKGKLKLKNPNYSPDFSTLNVLSDACRVGVKMIKQLKKNARN